MPSHLTDVIDGVTFDLKTAHPEFDLWRWAPFEDIAASIVPFKRPLYEVLLKEFATVAERLRTTKV